MHCQQSTHKLESLKIRELRVRGGGEKKCRKWFLIGCRMNHRRWVTRVWRRTKYLKGCCCDSSEGLQFSRSKTDSRSNSLNFFPLNHRLTNSFTIIHTYRPRSLGCTMDITFYWPSAYFATNRVLLETIIIRIRSLCNFFPRILYIFLFRIYERTDVSR